MLAFKLMNWKTLLKPLENKICQLKFKSTFNPITGTSNESNFGFLFDIDGVFVRGKTVLKRTKECIDLLTDKNGNFRVPVLFLTNAGNEMCISKSAKLSAMLNVNIRPEQVVMSHSPLRMATNFHRKHCLISGQGPIVEIAKFLGFNSVITVEDLRLKHPQLDVVDHKRRNFAPCVFSRYMPQIEAIILFGESVRWETNLQLIIDVIMCNGNLESVPKKFPSENLPILACNTDLLWMAEASMPRFGHGAFLHCLEQIYFKLSGNELKYSYIVGKPSSLTYLYAESMINKFSKSIGNKSLKRLYAIGDNVDTDVVGANSYNLQLQAKRNLQVESPITEGFRSEATSCSSILVRTGVYQGEQTSSSNYSHKDANIESRQKIPDYICDDVYDAVKMVYEIEKFK